MVISLIGFLKKKGFIQEGLFFLFKVYVSMLFFKSYFRFYLFKDFIIKQVGDFRKAKSIKMKKGWIVRFER